MIRGGRLARVVQMARLAPAALGGDREGQLTYEVLGNLKGGAQKLGQTLALVADGFPPAMRARLGALFGDAPPMPWADAEGVLRAELGDLGAIFEDIDEQPLASASLGQVYRARLRGGPEVAVKVQYPGVGTALMSDLANLELGAGPMAALVDGAAMLRGLRDALVSELDYRAEAARGLAMAEAVRPWPDLVVPEVHARASAERVLTTTLLPGPTLHASVDGLAPARREALATQLPAAILGPVWSGGLVNADTHPGNLLLLPDGRLGLVDMGAVCPVPRDRADALAAGMDQLLDGSATAATLRTFGVEPGPDRALAAEMLRLLVPLRPEPWDFARDDLMERMAAAKRGHALAMRHVRLAPELLPVIRATTGLHHALRRLGRVVPLGQRLEEVRREARRVTPAA